MLAVALQNTVPPRWRLLLNPLEKANLFYFISDFGMLGALVNQNNAHWVAIVKHASMLWLVDSCADIVRLSTTALVRLIDEYPSTFPLVEDGFPQ